MNISLDSNDISVAVVKYLQSEYKIDTNARKIDIDFVMGRGEKGLRASVKIGKVEPILDPDKTPEEILEILEENGLIQMDEGSIPERTNPLFEES
jgi:hypothetical protein